MRAPRAAVSPTRTRPCVDQFLNARAAQLRQARGEIEVEAPAGISAETVKRRDAAVAFGGHLRQGYSALSGRHAVSPREEARRRSGTLPR